MVLGNNLGNSSTEARRKHGACTVKESWVRAAHPASVVPDMMTLLTSVEESWPPRCWLRSSQGPRCVCNPWRQTYQRVGPVRLALKGLGPEEVTFLFGAAFLGSRVVAGSAEKKQGAVHLAAALESLERK